MTAHTTTGAPLQVRWTDAARAANAAATATRTWTTTMQEMAGRIARITDGVHRQINEPRAVARSMGHHMAQAGLSEVYHDPEGRDWYVQRIMRGTYPDTALMSPENRALVAVAAIRGWVTTHD